MQQRYAQGKGGNVETAWCEICWQEAEETNATVTPFAGREDPRPLHRHASLGETESQS
jgi:hypothetical protein